VIGARRQAQASVGMIISSPSRALFRIMVNRLLDL